MSRTRVRILAACILGSSQAWSQADRAARDPAPAMAATGREHWAFRAPIRPIVPELADDVWSLNPVDRFVLARMRAAGAVPAPVADRRTLIRRLSLDLLGLPPSTEAVEAFAADAAPDAYEHLVDTLLASPHYGERMALGWLDLARYGDTHGYHIDGQRDMWAWRDWVVDAFNRDLPFDQFTVDQLAGDLLPEPTLSQLVATGFNRNHMINMEGGADPDEYAVRYVVDRVGTTAETWLGLTVGCAECHDHKFDPITQREFYQLYALFANVPENGLDGYSGNAAPLIKVPSDAQREEAVARQAEIARRLRELDDPAKGLDHRQAEWEAELSARHVDGDVRDGLLAAFPLDGDQGGDVENVADAHARGQIVGSQIVHFVEGRLGRALRLDGTGTHVRVTATDPAVAGSRGFSVAAFVDPGLGGAVAGCWQEGVDRGWSLLVRNREVSLVLSHRLHDAAAEATVRGALYPGWNHVAATYDGSGRAAGITLYVNGQRVAPTAVRDELRDGFAVDQPLRIGGNETENGFEGALDDVRVYGRVLTPAEAGRLALQPVLAVLALPGSSRTAAARSLVQDHFRRHVCPESRAVFEAVRPLQAELEKLIDAVPTTMVMTELPLPRVTHVRVRGDYRRLGAAVQPAVPAVLPPLPADAKRNRLTFARWLVDNRNPLTARVFVNRVFAQLLGVGIVPTLDDFGTRGEPPTHPELLDWLADEFVRTGWHVKRLVRLLVTSATYRQAGGPADAEPGDLVGMRRLRLPAELIRDNALAIAGILDLRIGGPGVRPLQPPGLWEEVSYGAGYSAQTYVPSPVEDRYRRGPRLRRADARDLHRAARGHHHAGAGFRAHERPGLRRGGARSRGAHARGAGHR